jgi:Fe(3+) dicitrate transport protein
MKQRAGILKYLLLYLPFLGLNVNAQTIVLDSSKLTALDQVTIISSGSRIKIGSGAYIDSKTLGMLNQSNINHVLRMVPGVNIRDEEGFGLRPNIGLRGTSVNRSAKITLMEDGILIAPAPYADPSAYYFPTFARMHGVEVLKGSSQIKYGPYTIGGAVNLLSTPIPQSFKGFAQLSYGSFGTNQQRIWVGDSKKHFDYVVEFNRLASNGFKQLDGGGNTGFDRRDVMGKFRWHTDANACLPQSVSLKVVQMSELGNESYLGLSYDDFKANPLRRYAATQKDQLNMNHHHVSLNHIIAPSKHLNFVTKAYYSGTFRDWARVNTIGGTAVNSILANPEANKSSYGIMVGDSNGTIDFQSAARTFFSRGIETQAQFKFKSDGFESNAQLGVRYHEDQADRYATKYSYTMQNRIMVLTNSGIRGNQENQIRNASSVAAFFNYTMKWKGLVITPGLRYEDIRFELLNYGNADEARLGTTLKSASNRMKIFLPGIGLNYKIDPTMDVYAGIHKGFSPPGMPSVTSGVEQARPEMAFNYEIGYRYEYNKLRIDIAGFRSDYENILGSDNMSGGGAGTGDMFNAGNAVIQGLELSFNTHLTQGQNWSLPLQFCYTYTDAQFKDSFRNAGGDWGIGMIYQGDKIPFIPAHAFTLNLGFENKQFSANVNARYVGATRTKPGQGSIVTPSQENPFGTVNSIASFLLMDFSANYKMGRGLTCYTTINNFTNNRSIVANLPNGYRPNMPLSIMLGIKADIR